MNGPTRTVCYVCKARLSVDDSGRCQVCTDRIALERQITLDQRPLFGGEA